MSIKKCTKKAPHDDVTAFLHKVNLDFWVLRKL
jgi:hypothetical protein